MSDYIVIIDDWNGHREVNCETTDEVWKAINSRIFGGLFHVISPTGQDLSDFVTF